MVDMGIEYGMVMILDYGNGYEMMMFWIEFGY